MRKTTAIRKKIKEMLDTNMPVGRFKAIYDRYVEGLDETSMPYISMTVGSGVYDSDFGEQEAVVTLRVEITDKEVEDIEDLLDTHAELVEPVLLSDQSLSGLTEFIVPESFDYAVNKENGLGVIGLNYNVKYEV